jgi:hypothetical protein
VAYFWNPSHRRRISMMVYNIPCSFQFLIDIGHNLAMEMRSNNPIEPWDKLLIPNQEIDDSVKE